MTPVSSSTPDEQAAEKVSTADWIRAEHEPWGDNYGDVHCVTHGLMRDYVQHLADALDARAAASEAALVAVREQLTRVVEAVETFGDRGSIIAVRAVLDPPSPPTYTTEDGAAGLAEL